MDSSLVGVGFWCSYAIQHLSPAVGLPRGSAAKVAKESRAQRVEAW